MKYPKINSIFKRDELTKRFLTEYSIPEFEYLKDNLWSFSEKIDGTNTRIVWDGVDVSFGGKTDDAEIPIKLLNRLKELFVRERLFEVFGSSPAILYGEGFGLNIQSGGKYIRDGVDFILFDVLIDKWWLERDSLEDIAQKLSIRIVKIIGEGTLQDAIDLAHKGFQSEFGSFIAEGIVMRPKVQLFSRKGERIITKIKYKDFVRTG